MSSSGEQQRRATSSSSEERQRAGARAAAEAAAARVRGAGKTHGGFVGPKIRNLEILDLTLELQSCEARLLLELLDGLLDGHYGVGVELGRPFGAIFAAPMANILVE